MNFSYLLLCFAIYGLLSILFYLVPQAIISILPKKNLSKRYGKSWALVTGASQGCGKCFAQMMAEQGLNVILVARDAHALQEVENTLRAHKVETCVVVADLSGNAKEVAEQIYSSVKHYDISTLVINAGFTVPECSARPEVRSLDVLQTNVVTQMHLFSLLYPQICRRSLQTSSSSSSSPSSPPPPRAGGVIFMSSVNVELPKPFTQWYSATKSFLAQFARCLALEADAMGVDVVCVMPGFIRTQFQRRMPKLQKYKSVEVYFLSQSPEQVCSRVLRCIGVFVECHSGLMPLLMHIVVNLFGFNIIIPFISQVMRRLPGLKPVLDLSKEGKSAKEGRRAERKE